MFRVWIIAVTLFLINRGFHGAIWSGKLSNVEMLTGIIVQSMALVFFLKWSWPKIKKWEQELCATKLKKTESGD